MAKQPSPPFRPWRGGLAALAALAGLAGGGLAWVDTQPTWDDTGVSALVVAVISGSAAALGVPAWLAALAAAGPLILAGLWIGNMAALIALIPAILGAIAGSVARRAFRAAQGRDDAPT